MNIYIFFYLKINNFFIYKKKKLIKEILYFIFKKFFNCKEKNLIKVILKLYVLDIIRSLKIEVILLMIFMRCFILGFG